MQCKILGQSRKIRLVYIGNYTEGNFSDNNANKATFKVDAIKEVDEQGNEVGKTGAKKHALNKWRVKNSSSQRLTTCHIIKASRSLMSI